MDDLQIASIAEALARRGLRSQLREVRRLLSGLDPETSRAMLEWLSPSKAAPRAPRARGLGKPTRKWPPFVSRLGRGQAWPR